MKCPFELPVKKLEYEDPRISRDPERFLIVSPDGKFSLKRCNEECADYIVQAINSHKKLVDTLRKLRAEYDDNNHNKHHKEFHRMCKICVIDQALKEAEIK